MLCEGVKRLLARPLRGELRALRVFQVNSVNLLKLASCSSLRLFPASVPLSGHRGFEDEGNDRAIHCGLWEIYCDRPYALFPVISERGPSRVWYGCLHTGVTGTRGAATFRERVVLGIPLRGIGKDGARDLLPFLSFVFRVFVNFLRTSLVFVCPSAAGRQSG